MTVYQDVRPVVDAGMYKRTSVHILYFSVK
jgi:hypothetical protein